MEKLITTTTTRYAEWEMPNDYTEAAQAALAEYPEIKQASVSDHRTAGGSLIVIFDAQPGTVNKIKIEAPDLKKVGTGRNKGVRVIAAEKVEHNRPLTAQTAKLAAIAASQLETQVISAAVVLTRIEGEKTDVTVVSEPFVCPKRGRIHKYVSVQDHPVGGTVVYEEKWERCPV